MLITLSDQHDAIACFLYISGNLINHTPGLTLRGKIVPLNLKFRANVGPVLFPRQE
jgi:hypothetical protein